MTPHATHQSLKMPVPHTVNQAQTRRTNTTTRKSTKDANHHIVPRHRIHHLHDGSNAKKRDRNLQSEPNVKKNDTKQIPHRHESVGAELSRILKMTTSSTLNTGSPNTLIPLIPITICHPLPITVNTLHTFPSLPPTPPPFKIPPPIRWCTMDSTAGLPIPLQSICREHIPFPNKLVIIHIHRPRGKPMEEVLSI